MKKEEGMSQIVFMAECVDWHEIDGRWFMSINR